MPLSDEMKSSFAQGFQSFLKRTGQTRTEIAEQLGITPQVTSAWSRAVIVPSYEICKKLLTLEKPMTVSEMFGDLAATAQTLELAGNYKTAVDFFEEEILGKGRDLSIKDFQSGKYDYRKIIQDFVEVVVFMKHFPSQQKLQKILAKVKKLSNVHEAIQSEINWWESVPDKE